VKPDSPGFTHVLETSEVVAEERAHVAALSSALAASGTSVRQGIEQADALGVRDRADMFTEISRGIDKYLWFVEAHLG